MRTVRWSDNDQNNRAQSPEFGRSYGERVPEVTTDVRRQPLGAADAATWPALATLYILWGSTYLGVAIMVETMTPLVSCGIRFFLAAVALGGFLAIKNGPSSLRITKRQLRDSSIVGIALLGVGIGTVALAERFVPSGVVALLIAVTPLWIVLFRAANRDRPSMLTLIGVIIGFIGVGYMVLPGGTEPVNGTNTDVLLWSLLILLGSLSWAYFSWRARRMDLPKSVFVTSFYEMLAAAVFTTVLGFVTGERPNFAQASTASWLALAFLVFASIVGYSAYGWLLQNVRMSLVATYAYVNPVVAVLLAWLIIGEQITTDIIFGSIFIVGGVILVVSGERR